MDERRRQRQLDLYEGAYASGWLESELEVLALAGLLLRMDRASDASVVLEQNMKIGLITEADENMRLLEYSLESQNADPSDESRERQEEKRDAIIDSAFAAAADRADKRVRGF